jgi:hypothetical protein
LQQSFLQLEICMADRLEEYKKVKKTLKSSVVPIPNHGTPIAPVPLQARLMA